MDLDALARLVEAPMTLEYDPNSPVHWVLNVRGGGAATGTDIPTVIWMATQAGIIAWARPRG